MKKLLAFLLSAMLFSLPPSVSLSENAKVNLDDYFSKRDLSGEWNASKAVEMTLTESVTISEEGVYILSGTIEDGTVTVKAGKNDKVQLVLSGVRITASSSAAILVENADKVFITLAEGTENYLTSTGFDEDSGVDAAVYARDDVIFNGKGALTIVSDNHGIVGKDAVKFAGGEYHITAQGRGVSSKGTVRVADGAFTIVSEKDAVRAKNDNAEKGYILIAGGTFDLTVGGGAENGQPHTDERSGRGGWNSGTGSASEDADSAKGLKATGDILLYGGKITVNAADDAIHSNTRVLICDGAALAISTGDDAIHSDDLLIIEGGEINVLVSYEGLEGTAIEINGGRISITSSDDGLNSAGGNDGSGRGWNDMFASDGSSITVNGGFLYVNAAGDGMDANGDLTVNGGTVVVSGPTNSYNGALDANGAIAVHGGMVIAAGAVGMAETFGSSSTQVSFLTNLSGGENSEITVTDPNGAVILSGRVEKSFSCVVISCPELKVGETYTVSSGASSVAVTISAVSTERNGGRGGPGGRPW